MRAAWIRFPRRRGTHRSRRGFTLFEVLAAASILALFYTMLAGSAIEGITSEGISRRRMEASLLADERLADIELAMQSGTVPALGESEDEDEPFIIRVAVTPFDAMGLMSDEIEVAQGAQGLLDSTGDSPLRLIDLRVSWLELDRELEVRRTTFAYDRQVLAELATQAENGGNDGGGGDNEPEGSDDAANQFEGGKPTVDDILNMLGELAQ